MMLRPNYPTVSDDMNSFKTYKYSTSGRRHCPIIRTPIWLECMLESRNTNCREDALSRSRGYMETRRPAQPTFREESIGRQSPLRPKDSVHYQELLQVDEITATKPSQAAQNAKVQNTSLSLSSTWCRSRRMRVLS